MRYVKINMELIFIVLVFSFVEGFLLVKFLLENHIVELGVNSFELGLPFFYTLVVIAMITNFAFILLGESIVQSYGKHKARKGTKKKK